ncbi:molybdopterin synthase small subunit [Staphylococcus schleiferi]|uniref:Molybdopterin synthase sulfur carrier subunit n=1 Tax=Staphylococcus coagulans TaxID=74706 RepID=A0A9X1DZN2_9STAP|nr:molybdopterin converting factor subunit 1 [Staphylococcus coagulans]AKS66478.1 molybdopterin synthase small subunit [Staphylococcus schleiferi]NHB72284.1 molybdopterin converting factor subunit 1 [Staphylococcus sp. 191]AKS68595.1 molybdopterin synthase small subunit [Staphylococcus schleiferi]AKS70819.1 molybdopterin synthase small subunit [Staphylococcus schleiferi]AKS72990.1 molybdopterin synthase small subunit [Staphylococcus schleiferi]
MKVLYFAEIKELLGQSEETFHFDHPIAVTALKQHLYQNYPAIQGKKFQVAINEDFAQVDDVIQPNDVVALIPPVSGG